MVAISRRKFVQWFKSPKTYFFVPVHPVYDRAWKLLEFFCFAFLQISFDWERYLFLNEFYIRKRWATVAFSIKKWSKSLRISWESITKWKLSYVSLFVCCVGLFQCVCVSGHLEFLWNVSAQRCKWKLQLVTFWVQFIWARFNWNGYSHINFMHTQTHPHSRSKIFIEQEL